MGRVDWKRRAPVKRAMRHRLVKIIGFRCWRWKMSRGRGIIPVIMRTKGKLNFDPRKIPTTQAQLRQMSDNSTFPYYQSATVIRCLICS